MFNLEQAIGEWRRRMLAADIKSPMPLEELESHLREDVAAIVLAGKSEPEAFQRAVARLGSPASVRMEFNKINCRQILSAKIASLLWLAAVMATAAVRARGLLAGKLSLLLYAHILAVTAGYGAAFLIGLVGICSVCWRLFDRLSSVRQQSLRRTVRLFSQLGAGLVIVGILLGLPVSEHLFGSVWTWDPKEIGALCAVVWFIVLAVTERFGRVSNRGLMVICIAGNVVVSLAWFGARIVDYNRKMHGHGTAGYRPLALFLGLQIFFLIAGLAPMPDRTETLDAPE